MKVHSLTDTSHQIQAKPGTLKQPANIPLQFVDLTVFAEVT